jgi:hypothetical protein
MCLCSVKQAQVAVGAGESGDLDTRDWAADMQPRLEVAVAHKTSSSVWSFLWGQICQKPAQFSEVWMSGGRERHFLASCVILGNTYLLLASVSSSEKWD